MNAKNRLVQSGVIAFMAWTAMVSAWSCQTQPTAVVHFEPEPRAVLAKSGISPSRHAKLGVDQVTSATLYMLAVLGEGEHSRIGLLTSDDGGDTFKPPVFASLLGAGVSSHGEDSPGLLVTPSVIYAAWNEDLGICFARSLTWGSNFEPPVYVSNRHGSSFSGYVSIGMAPNGDIYLLWLDTRDKEEIPDTFSLYMARSTNKGASFGKNIRVATGVCPCCRPNLAFGRQGEVMVFWRKVYPGNIRDMTVAVTSDGGDHFTDPLRIAADNWHIEGCPDSGPATTWSGKRIYVAWLTEASPDRSGVRLTWSDDSGNTWAPAVMASQNILDANYPAMSVSNDGHVALVFQGRDPQKRAGWEKVGVFLVDIGSDGKLSSPQAVPGIASSASRPTVALGTGGRVYIAWTGTNEGNPSVLLSRARRELR
ncbi:MAG: sialidase family protein [Terriglobia bacterium]